MGCCALSSFASADQPPSNPDSLVPKSTNTHVVHTSNGPLSQEQNKLNIVVEKNHITSNIDVDAWDYSANLNIDEVTEMLKDLTLENTNEFKAPINYGKCVKVYDGDTIHIVAPLFNGVISRFKIRIYGIDCPEIRTKDVNEKQAGHIAKKILSDRILNQIIQCYDVGQDKYGRILCKIKHENVEIHEFMLDTGFACEYLGKGEKLTKKINWQERVDEYIKQNPDYVSP